MCNPMEKIPFIDFWLGYSFQYSWNFGQYSNLLYIFIISLYFTSQIFASANICYYQFLLKLQSSLDELCTQYANALWPSMFMNIWVIIKWNLVSFQLISKFSLYYSVVVSLSVLSVANSFTSFFSVAFSCAMYVDVLNF